MDLYDPYDQMSQHPTARPKIHFTRWLPLLFLMLVTGPLGAELKLHPFLTSDGILQRDKPVPISGMANAGEKVSVQFGNQTVTTEAGPDGRWLARLEPMAASATGAALVVSSPSGRAELSNILVGDVWLCAGQSNMDWYVARSMNAAEEMAAADYPAIRLFTVRYAAADTPQSDMVRDSLRGYWKACSQSGLRRFSAVAYFFAREFHQQTGVPVGVIVASRGGTQIESWMSEKSLKSTSHYDSIMRQWQDRLDEYPARYAVFEKALADHERRKANGEDVPARAPRPPEGKGSRWTPAGLFNAMIHPLIPYALRGVIWYQGEANTVRFHQYGELFQTMIRQWREDFAQPDLGFYFVQLAGHQPRLETTRQLWAYLREAQVEALELPRTGMAVAIDIGEENNVHPENKQDVGRRLALAALADLYEKPIVASGPQYDRAQAEDGKMRLFFKPGTDLVLREKEPGGFELAGKDQVFHPAQAAIDGETLLVSSAEVPEPLAVRYAWYNYPSVSLYNREGLPAAPFRSDDWPPPPPPGAQNQPDEESTNEH